VGYLYEYLILTFTFKNTLSTVSDLATIDSQFINFIDNSVTNTETLLNDEVYLQQNLQIELPDVIRMCNLDNS